MILRAVCSLSPRAGKRGHKFSPDGSAPLLICLGSLLQEVVFYSPEVISALVLVFASDAIFDRPIKSPHAKRPRSSETSENHHARQ